MEEKNNMNKIEFWYINGYDDEGIGEWDVEFYTNEFDALRAFDYYVMDFVGEEAKNWRTVADSEGEIEGIREDDHMPWRIAVLDCNGSHGYLCEGDDGCNFRFRVVKQVL